MRRARYQSIDAEEQRAIVAEYQPGVHGSSMGAIAQSHGLPKSSVQTIIERNREFGDPVTPRGHKKRKLEPEPSRSANW
jgi:transposase